MRYFQELKNSKRMRMYLKREMGMNAAQRMMHLQMKKKRKYLKPTERHTKTAWSSSNSDGAGKNSSPKHHKDDSRTNEVSS